MRLANLAAFERYAANLERHRIIAAIVAILIAWYLIESDTRDACAGDQTCIAASL